MAYYSALVTGANRGIGYQFGHKHSKDNYPVHYNAQCQSRGKAIKAKRNKGN